MVDTLGLESYQPFQVVRADLLARVGRGSAAVRAYDRALELTGNAVERAHLQRRRGDCLP